MSKSRFYIEITYEAEFPIDSLWPDKDGPENPTVEDVQRLIRGVGIEEVAHDWFLRGDARLHVQRLGVKNG